MGRAVRIAIVAPTPVPFTRGGAERAWSGLHAALLEAGHEADVVKLPVRERTLAELVAGYRAFAELDLAHFDVVISSKYPAWICPHPRHVLWMFHPLRGLYDTYHLFGMPTAPGPVEPPVAALLATLDHRPERAALDEVLGAAEAAVAAVGADHPQLAIPSPVARLVVRWLDRLALDPGQISRHVALSRTVATRADYLPPGVAPRVAYAPSDLVPPGSHAAPPGGRAPGSYLFTASRLDGPKRLDLLLEAYARVPGDLPLLVGGTGPEAERLGALAARDPRVELLGFVPDDDLPGLYAGARAVPFVPLDEDYGLITVEAMALGTPVVTCSDSGGPTELVHDGVDGLVAAPQPDALAGALGRVVADPEGAAAMGEAARRRAARITWPAAVRTLLGAGAGDRPAPAVAPPRRERRPGVPRVVVLTTFRVAERGHGGQLRSYHLYGALARHAEVEIVSLAPDGPADRVELTPGLVETAVPRSPAHRAAADELTLEVGTPMSDLVAGEAIALTPEYLARLREAGRDADVAIVAEPYLLPALAAAGLDALPFVYDAFNVEAELKADVLPATPAGDAALRRIVALEADAVRRAAAVTACSAEDAARLAAMGGRARADVVVVPNGTDVAGVVPPTPTERTALGGRWLARAAALEGRRPDRGLAVFFGSWHPPNLAAAELLLELAAEVRDVTFVLGGRHGDAFAGRPRPRNAVFAGVVSDRARDTLLRAAHVALNPMVFGSGTNLKIIEYLAAGVPVVSTDVGTRGLDVEPGRHLLVAPPEGFAAAIAEVLDQPDEAAARAAAGRERAEERYAWPLLGDRLAEVVSGVAGGGAAWGRRGGVR